MVGKGCFVFVLLAVALRQSIATELKTEDCGSHFGKVTGFSINCDKGSTKDYCIVSKGHKYTSELKIIPNKDIDNGTIAIAGKVGMINHHVNIPDNNMCHHGLQCPLKAGEEVTMSLSMDGPNSHFHVTVHVKMEIKTHGQDFICLKYKIKVR